MLPSSSYHQVLPLVPQLSICIKQACREGGLQWVCLYLSGVVEVCPFWKRREIEVPVPQLLTYSEGLKVEGLSFVDDQIVRLYVELLNSTIGKNLRAHT